MVEYKVATNSFETTISACEAPMVPCRDHGNLPPALWGGQGTRPVLVNPLGEFKTREELEDIYETEAYYTLIDQGFGIIKAFAEVDATPDEDLEIYRGSHCGDYTVVAEFTPCSENRDYIEVLDEDDVISWSADVLVPHEEISEGRYVAFVVLRAKRATYKVDIAVNKNQRRR